MQLVKLQSFQLRIWIRTNYSDPDPAKRFRSFRIQIQISIHNTDKIYQTKYYNKLTVNSYYRYFLHKTAIKKGCYQTNYVFMPRIDAEQPGRCPPLAKRLRTGSGFTSAVHNYNTITKNTLICISSPVFRIQQ